MANELTLSNSFTYDDGKVKPIGRALESLVVNVSTKRFSHQQHNIGVTEEAVTLGEVATLGWFWLRNLDTTNFVEWRVSTGSTKAARANGGANGGEAMMFRVGSGVTAPYLIADTGAVDVEYFLFAS